MKQSILLLIAICTMGCLQSKASGIDHITPGPGKINEVSGSIFDGDSKKPLQNVTVTAYSASRKEKFVLTDEFKSGTYKLVFEKEGYRKVVREKVTIKTDETFQMRIEMLESESFDLMPSPFQFFDTK
jgi:hypothetical protein